MPHPLSRKPHDWYGAPLFMTPVDAYDTMLLMGLTAEAADAKRLILEHLSFDQDASVQVFEVTIRLLGGLIAAYQMDHDPGFLRLAAGLGDRLLPAFRSPTGMPFRYVNLRTGETRDPVSNPAEIGTLMLEFGTLGKLTGRPVYYATAKRAVEELFRRRSALGLVGSTIDVRTGAWQDTTSHVGGGIDSYYEYLLKSWLLFGDEELGDPKTDSARLHRISPLFNADKIAVPLMVLQGANDPRVLKVESDEIVAAVKKKGIPVEYVLFDDEGHGFVKKENEIKGYTQVLEFLDLHLKGKGAAEPPTREPASGPAP